MKLNILLLGLALPFSFGGVCLANYDSYQINRDGTYVCGGAYDGYKINRDGTYAMGWKKATAEKE